MNDNQKVFGLVALVILAAIALDWWKKDKGQSAPSSGGGCSLGEPAYLCTAATDEPSVPGVPEENSCPGSPSKMAPIRAGITPNSDCEGLLGCR